MVFRIGSLGNFLAFINAATGEGDPDLQVLLCRVLGFGS